MRLETASGKAVKYACMNFHYAKAIPVFSCAYSVFNDDNEWCGVIIYSHGATNHIGNPYGLQQGKVCELVRVALNGKQEFTSKAVSLSIKLLRKQNPLLKLIVSYADMDENHFGTLYQALNWIYVGFHTQGMECFIVNGKKMHKRSVGAKGIVQSLAAVKKYLDPNAEKFKGLGKHKYLYPLDKSLIPLCKSLSKPYPKKETAVKAQEKCAEHTSPEVAFVTT